MSKDNFLQDFGRIIETYILKKFGKSLNKNIWERAKELDRAIGQALQEFPQTVDRWNARRDQGGLAFQTYRATCKRQGVFRDRNWNDDL